MPRLEIGTNDPFEPRPEGRFVIEQGFQGGHHVDVSVRVTGDMDPAHTDIELVLEHDDRLLGQHVVADWLLHPDSEGRFCDYPRARLVFVDDEGGLLPAEAMPELVEKNMQLRVRLASIPGTAEQTFPVVFTDVLSLEL